MTIVFCVSCGSGKNLGISAPVALPSSSPISMSLPTPSPAPPDSTPTPTPLVTSPNQPYQPNPPASTTLPKILPATPARVRQNFIIDSGATGDATCGAAGGTCVRVIRKDGLKAIGCEDGASDSIPFKARCCQTQIIPAAPAPSLVLPQLMGSSCELVVVPKDGSGDAACSARGASCESVVASTGEQSIYCYNPVSNGISTVPEWRARCCRSLKGDRPLYTATGASCANFALPAGQTGENFCRARAASCTGVISSHDNERSCDGTSTEQNEVRCCD